MTWLTKASFTTFVLSSTQKITTRNNIKSTIPMIHKWFGFSGNLKKNPQACG
jgi:hypothetical protein